MMGWMQKHINSQCAVLICFHTHHEQEAVHLEKNIKRLLSPGEIYISELTPVIGAHTGPSVLGVAWWQG